MRAVLPSTKPAEEPPQPQAEQIPTGAGAARQTAKIRGEQAGGRTGGEAAGEATISEKSGDGILALGMIRAGYPTRTPGGATGTVGGEKKGLISLTARFVPAAVPKEKAKGERQYHGVVSVA